MAWIEVYGGQRSLAFELTTAFFILYKTLNLAICRWTKGIVELFFFALFLVNNYRQSETNWQVPVKVTTCPTLMSTRNASIPVETNNPDRLAQIWRMEQAGEMVGQLNGEFSSFNDNTLSYGYISSVVDLFWGIDSFYAIFRGNLRKGRTWRNGACFQEKPSVKLA